MKQEIGSGYHRGSKTVRENHYLTFITPTKKDKNSRRQRIEKDPDAMEVDTAEIGKTSFKRMDPKEMQHLKSRGRCFHCKQQGHMSRQCPKKSNEQRSSNQCQPPPGGRQTKYYPDWRWKDKPSTRVTKVESLDKSTKESDSDSDTLAVRSQASVTTNKASSLITRINRLTTKEKTEVVDALINKGF